MDECRTPLQAAIFRKQLFYEVVIKRYYDVIFPTIIRKDYSQYSTLSVYHFLMRRLHQPYNDLLSWDVDEKMTIFEWELNLYEKANETEL